MRASSKRLLGNVSDVLSDPRRQQRRQPTTAWKCRNRVAFYVGPQSYAEDGDRAASARTSNTSAWWLAAAKRRVGLRMTSSPHATSGVSRLRRPFDSSRTRVGAVMGALSAESTGDPHLPRCVFRRCRSCVFYHVDQPFRLVPITRQADATVSKSQSVQALYRRWRWRHMRSSREPAHRGRRECSGSVVPHCSRAGTIVAT